VPKLESQFRFCFISLINNYLNGKTPFATHGELRLLFKRYVQFCAQNCENERIVGNFFKLQDYRVCVILRKYAKAEYHFQVNATILGIVLPDSRPC
jgi:hypothetical protein